MLFGAQLSTTILHPSRVHGHVRPHVHKIDEVQLAAPREGNAHTGALVDEVRGDFVAQVDTVPMQIDVVSREHVVLEVRHDSDVADHEGDGARCALHGEGEGADGLDGHEIVGCRPDHLGHGKGRDVDQMFAIPHGTVGGAAVDEQAALQVDGVELRHDGLNGDDTLSDEAPRVTVDVMLLHSHWLRRPSIAAVAPVVASVDHLAAVACVAVVGAPVFPWLPHQRPGVAIAQLVDAVVAETPSTPVHLAAEVAVHHADAPHPLLVQMPVRQGLLVVLLREDVWVGRVGGSRLVVHGHVLGWAALHLLCHGRHGWLHGIAAL